LNKFPENFSNEFCSCGQKGKGWGEGIFARSRFHDATGFRASEAGAPTISVQLLKLVRASPKIARGIYCLI